MVEPVEYTPVERREAEALFTALPKEQKWAKVVGALLGGQSVFVPGMTRNQLESVRSITNHRKYGRLKSRQIEMDGVVGRLLKMVPQHQGRA